MRIILFRTVLTSLIVIYSGLLSGQTEKIESIHSIKATIIGLSYSYEQLIFQQTVVNFEFMIGGGLGSNWKAGDNWLIVPSVRLEPRCYYNFYKRGLKEKFVTHNSSDYIALSADYQFHNNLGSSKSGEEYFSLIPKWGLRRSIGDHFFFEGAAGVGAYTSKSEKIHALVGVDLKIGYAF
jgi:hypothetical protein